jgi:hypothetical protein
VLHARRGRLSQQFPRLRPAGSAVCQRAPGQARAKHAKDVTCRNCDLVI